ncbi:unnamed protein product [Scytosiphon promiscuus]
MGQCTCSIEERDLDGGGSDVASNIVRGTATTPPVARPSMSSSSSSFILSSPLPPPVPCSRVFLPDWAVEDQLAAGGDGGCRYGTGCKRANCSFSHPQGMKNGEIQTMADHSMGLLRTPCRRLDSGAKGGVGGAKSTAEQDLMDTWYPDCRECVCCKGYKHGCKTPACAAAGLCACSSGDGPVAPISAVPAPSAGSSSSGGAAGGGVGDAGAVAAAEGGETTPPPSQATA